MLHFSRRIALAVSHRMQQVPSLFATQKDLTNNLLPPPRFSIKMLHPSALARPLLLRVVGGTVISLNAFLTLQFPFPKLTPILRITGLVNKKDNRFYTSNMNIEATASLVRDFDTLARRALKDDLVQINSKSEVDYVNDVFKNLDSFTGPKGSVVGREEESDSIREIFLRKGRLAFITGGPSVGKTKMMNNLIADIEKHMDESEPGQPRVEIIYLNGRSMESIADRLRNFLSGLNTDVGYKDLAGNTMEASFQPPPPRSVILAECVAALANKNAHGTNHTVLVLDEANLFLEPEVAADTEKLFHALVANTKENMKMTAILLSADSTLPSLLEDIGLNTAHISDTLMVGGASPAAAREHLKKMGCGPHLRDLLVSIYGGHMLNITLGVWSLSHAVRRGLKATGLRGTLGCVRKAMGRWVGEGGDPADLITVLQELARSGFYCINESDKRVRLLIQSNVCDYLMSGATEFFVDPKVRQGRHGVVASTQLMRVLIAFYLQESA